MVWNEYVNGSGGVGSEVVFDPKTTQISSGEVKFNILDFLNEAIATSGGTVDSSRYLAGMDWGTEFGDATSTAFTLTDTKIEYEEQFKSCS